MTNKTKKLTRCHQPILVAKETEKAVAVTYDGGQTFDWLPKSQIETATLNPFQQGYAVYVIRIASWLADEKRIITPLNKHKFPPQQAF